MRSKIWCFVFLFLVFSAVLVSGLEASDIREGLEESAVVGGIEKITDEEARSDYLRQEWGKLLENTTVGQALLFVSGVLAGLSPIFLFLIGVEYSLSWFFFLSLGLWIVIFIIIYRPAKAMFPAHWWTASIIALFITAIAARVGVIPRFLDYLSPLVTNKWIALLAVVIGIVIVYVYSLFMKAFGKVLNAKLKKEKEARREQKADTAEKISDIKIKGGV